MAPKATPAPKAEPAAAEPSQAKNKTKAVAKAEAAATKLAKTTPKRKFSIEDSLKSLFKSVSNIKQLIHLSVSVRHLSFSTLFLRVCKLIIRAKCQPRLN